MNLLKEIFNEFYKMAWKWLLAGIIIGAVGLLLFLGWLARMNG